MDFSHINFLAVIVATVAAFALGMLRYAGLFGKLWQRELGMTDEQMKGANMAMIFGSTLVLRFAMALGMAMLWHTQNMDGLTWMVGMYHGLFFGLMFVATSMGINCLYQRKSMTLWLIDAGYQVCFMAVIGAILRAWH
jgi:hypothetical protein